MWKSATAKCLSYQSWYNAEVADSAMFKYVKDLDKASNQRMDPVRKEACVLSRMVVKLMDQDLELRLCHTHSSWIPVLTHAMEGTIAFLIGFLKSS